MPLSATDLPEPLMRLEYLLDEAGGDAMALSELDGYLCGILVSPDPIAVREWWPSWLDQGANPELARSIEARFATIEGELAEGKYAPLYDVDEETGDIAWPVWLAGFEQAMQMRFDLWDALLRHPFQDVIGEAVERLSSALLLAQPGFGPDDSASEADWADYDATLAAIPQNLAIAAMLLYQANNRD